VRRNDYEHLFTLQVERELWDHLVGRAYYVGDLHGSNLPEFEYDRHILSVGIQYWF
jgi:hypothetical protein